MNAITRKILVNELKELAEELRLAKAKYIKANNRLGKVKHFRDRYKESVDSIQLSIDKIREDIEGGV